MANKELMVTLGIDSSTFTQKIKKANELNKSLDKSFKLLSNSSENFENSLSGLSRKQEYLNNKMKVASAESEVYSKRIKECQQSLLKAEADSQKYAEKLEELKNIQEETRVSLGKTSNEYKSIKEEIKKYTQLMDKANKSITSNDRKLLSAINGYKDCQIALQNLGKEAVFVSEKMSAMKADEEMKKLSDSISDSENSFQNMRKSIVNFDNTMNGVEKSQSHYNEQIKKTIEFMELQKKEIENSKKTIKSYEEEIKNVGEELEELENILSDLDNTDEVFVEMSKEVDDLRAEYTNLNKTLDFHKQRISELEGQYKKSENSLSDYSNKLSKVGANMVELNQKVSFEPIQKSVDELAKISIKRLSQELNNLESDFERMEISFKGYDNTVTGLNVKQRQFAKMLNLASQNMNIYGKDIIKTTKEIDNLSKEYDELEKELIKQSELIKTLKGEEWDSKAKEIDNLKTRYYEVNKELEQHKTKLEGLNKTYDTAKTKVASLSSELKQAGNKIEEIEQKEIFDNLQRGTDLAKQKVSLLDSKFELLKSRVGFFENTLKGLNATLDYNSNKIEALTSELKSYERQIGGNIDYINKLEARQRVLEDSCDALTRKLKNMSDTNPNYDKTMMALAGLENELKENTKEIETFKRANDDLQIEIDQTGTKINELIRANKTLKGTWYADKLKGFGDKLGTIGSAISSLGNSTIGLTYGIAGIGLSSIKTGEDFEKSMSQVKALTGATGSEFEKLTNTAREMGSKTVFTAKESADALGYLALAGYDVEQACGALPTILMGAQAGAMDLATASDKATDSISALGYIGTDAVKMLPEYMNKVAQSASSSNTSMEQMLDAYIKVGGQLNILKIPLDTSASMLGVLANRGAKGAEAGNALNSILINMTQTSGQSAKAMEELGVSMFDANGQIRPVEEVMVDLAKALHGLSEEKQVQLINMIGGKTQAKTFQKLLQGMVTDTGNLTEEYKNLKNEIATAPQNNALLEMANTMTDNLWGDLQTLKSAVSDLFLEFMKAFSPELREIVQGVTDKIHDLTEKIKNLTPEQKEMVLKMMGLIAVAPLALKALGFMISVIGGLSKVIGFSLGAFTKLKDKVGKTGEEIGKTGEKANESTGMFGRLGDSAGILGGFFQKLEEKIVSNGGKLGELVGKFGLFSTVATPLAIGAFAGIIASIGENETALLKLQEKWGGLGICMSAVCEFISGLWDLTVKQIINLFTLLFDIIGAIIDGAGNTTIKGAWEKFNANQQLIVEEGFQKLALSTTRGMATLRNLQDVELTAMVSTLDTTMSNIPLIVDQKYQEASNNIAISLQQMNQNQLDALTNLNDTTRTLFSGIREGMTIEEIVPVLISNFEQINKSGKFNVEDMKEGISQAMETTRGQMDSKTAEGASAVEGNMDKAKQAVNSATGAMTTDAQIGMSNVAGAMIDESGKIPPEIKTNMDTSARTIETTLSTMAKNIEKSFNDLCYNAEHYLQRIITKANEVGNAFSSCSSTVYNFASNSMRWIDTASNNIVSDWNRVVSTLNRNITGSVTINRQINESVVSKPATVSMNDVENNLDGRVAYMQERVNNLVAQARVYQPTTIMATQSKKQSQENYEIINSLKEQNNLLMEMLGVLMEEKQTVVNTSVQVSGREIARASAKYMNSEIKTLNKFNDRRKGIL